MQTFIYMHIYTYAMIINGAKTVMSYYVATNLSVLKCKQTAQSSSFCKHHHAFFQSVNSLLHKKLANILTLCLLEAAPLLSYCDPSSFRQCFICVPHSLPLTTCPFPTEPWEIFTCSLPFFNHNLTSLLWLCRIMVYTRTTDCYCFSSSKELLPHSLTQI